MPPKRIFEHPIHDLLAARWSPRAFSPRAVEPARLAQIMEAARWAPSCFNDQPWRYIVATSDQPAEFDRILACLVESNRAWAKAAPVLMISIAAQTFSRTGKPNRHGMHDVGLASAQLSLQATALGLAVHQMGGFDPAAARAEFRIPPEFEPAAAIAIGYPGDPESLPPELRQRELTPSPRRPLSEFVFSGAWGAPAPWTRP